ncbi:hypothetical protein RS84_00226 [Microbacterium hydrocarbonoxydans]|uniref:Uncharacterized protein n=1 Tax=Microbacterium hydrocarbonoxydans TaxID=273678 RepID=A0A0M2HYJ1_9MICO|nr:hypothetical protein [Microbacterium hydrocarbonoxydans]KJL49513.1 hypothetical protein RS84_00226 [Microbacterium hydrocarbonoxydans]
MPRFIRTPDAGLNDQSHSWLHSDGSITPATDEEIDRIIGDEPTLG